ncbi:phenylacetate--CoA ligase family protein [Brevundimonas sp.]|jgi:phenylacetate-CoA ligase|uniref:phenylacetate--CoA ligase family protein n=1 Tax=Brevundimonas sp. TaxID=1871086 RepID=UPI003784E892
MPDASATLQDRTLNPSGNGLAYQVANASKWGEQKFFDAIEGAPREEIEATQERLLLDQLKWIATRSALVSEIWKKAGVDPLSITSLADYKARAPFMDKDDIRAFRDRTDDPFGGVLCVDCSELHNIGSSSGTTGDPTIFAERWDRGYEGPFTPREYWMLGLRPGDYVLEMSTVMRGVGHRITRAAGAIPLMLNHDPNEVEAAVDLIRKYRPTIFFHLSTPVIYGLERLEREKGIDMVDLFSSFRACVYGGEPVGPRMKETLDRWGVNLFQFSSLGDSGTTWECEAHDGFHAWEDVGLVEVLKPGTDEPVGDGEGGELVVTALHNKTDPLIRYRSGDFIRHTREKCACGRTHMRMTLLGRLGDEVIVNRTSILPRDVWTAVEQVEETSAGLFQIIRPQRELTELKLRVGYEGTPEDLADVARRVADEVEKRVSVRPEIEMTPNSELIKLGPPHKIPRVAKA